MISNCIRSFANLLKKMRTEDIDEIESEEWLKEFENERSTYKGWMLRTSLNFIGALFYGKGEINEYWIYRFKGYKTIS